MINSLKREIFMNSGNYEPNTFIGGVAVSGGIETKMQLASTLNIPIQEIKAFRIIGDDIECHIKIKYTINNSFKDNTDITYYLDEDEKVTKLIEHAFKGASKLKTVNLLGVTEIYGPNNDTSGVFWDCVLLEDCVIDNITTINGYNHFRNTPKLLELDLTNLMGTPSARVFQNCNVAEFDFQSLISLGSESMMQNVVIINTPVLVNVSNRAFFQANKVKVLNLPNVTNISNKQSVFSQMYAAEQINAKNLKYFGNPADIGNNGGTGSFIAFFNLKKNCYIRVNIELATVNSGGVDVALQWAKDERDAIVEFYDDNGDYVSTL